MTNIYVWERGKNIILYVETKIEYKNIVDVTVC